MIREILFFLILSMFCKELFAEQECNEFIAEVKLSCTYHEFWEDESMTIKVDFPIGLGCGKPPFSGTISIPDSGKVITVYEPRVVWYSLARDIELTKITYKENSADNKIIDLYCIDAIVGK